MYLSCRRASPEHASSTGLSSIFPESGCRCSTVDSVLSFHYTFGLQMLERANFQILHAVSWAFCLHRHNVHFFFQESMWRVSRTISVDESFEDSFFFFLIRISKSWLKTGNDTSGTAAFLGCWWCLRTSPRSWLSHTWLEFLLFSGEKFQTSTVGKFWSILYLQADFAFCVGLKNYGSERTDANDHPWPLRNEIFKHNIKSTLWLQGWFRWGHNFFTWAVVYEEQEKE